MQKQNDESGALYRKIETELRHKVDSGILTVGAALPSRRDLAREYKVSTLTIDRAIDRMIRDGILRSDDRRGTYVAPRSKVVVLDTPKPEISQRTIGVVGTLYPHRHDHLELNNYWSRLLTHAIEGAFAEHGYTSLFQNRIREDGGIRKLSDAVNEALEQNIDGIAILAFGHSPSEVDDCAGLALSRGVPVVCVTAGALSRPAPHVFLDGQDAGYQAAEHIANLGCKKILFLSPFASWWTEDRIRGARIAIDHAGLNQEDLLIYPDVREPWVNELDPETLGYESAIAAFNEGIVPDGVICASDGVALGFIRAAAEKGLALGKDIRMIGFDDRPESRIRNLTSLRPSMEAMGNEAAQLLRKSLEHRLDCLQVRLRWRLIVRASSGSSQQGS